MFRPATMLLAALLAGCGPDYSPNTYSASAVQQANKVEQGVVVGVRDVDVLASGNTGAVTGAAAGGIAGSQASGTGVGQAIGALGGGLIGGIVGTGVERTVQDTRAFEYVVRKGNGELVSVTQKDVTPLALGQHVLVIAGNQARIVADYTVPPTDPAPKPPAPAAPPASNAAPTAAAQPAPPAGPTPLTPPPAPAPAVEAAPLPAPAS